ncbi:MAG: hypothetical protein ACREIU_15045, partial [Planctomycetota bacterium]
FTASLSTEPGALFHLFLANGTSQGIPLGSRRFALDPDQVFWTTAALPFLTDTLDSAGAASISIPVPPNPALSGLTLFFAGVTIDPAFPYGARTLGTARWLTIQ